MPLQTSDAVANARLDVVESTIGASAKLKIFSGPAPINCAAANTGTELAHLDLPADYMAAASARSKAKLGTWSDPEATASGDAGHFRIYSSDGATCHIQGSITATGGGGNMTITNLAIALGQLITITGFTLNEPA